MNVKKDNINIIFVVVDALRARNLSCYGFKDFKTPTFDWISKQGTVFDNAFSCAECTIPSLTTIFSGKYPISHGIIGFHTTKNELDTLNSLRIKFLPEILRLMGYKTFALDWIGKWLKKGYDFYYGMPTSRIMKNKIFKKSTHICNYIPQPFYNLFEKIWRKLVYPRILYITGIESAEIFTDYAIKLIKNNIDQKFFLFIHYWDTHRPYNAPENFIEPVEEGKDLKIEDIINSISKQEIKVNLRNTFVKKGITTADQLISKYYGSIKYVDYQLARLIDALDDMGIADNTLMIVTSDHGESLIEHGIYFTHHGLYDETVHVPLIFRGPGIPKNKRISGLVQHVDIMPTILDIIGIKGYEVDGKSFMPLIKREKKTLRNAVYIEEATEQRKRAIRTFDYKYIHALSKEGGICKECGRIHGGLEELYDLNNDPLENCNIIEDKPDIAKYLRENLDYWVKAMNQKREKKIIKIKLGSLKNKGI